MKTSRLILVAAAALLVSAVAPASLSWAQSESSQSSEQAVAAQARAEHAKLLLRGAKLWPVYCNTCHNARPGSDFSPAEWQMIMMHMRTQANLPAEDAKAILTYLKQR
jgi:cytochrome c5